MKKVVKVPVQSHLVQKSKVIRPIGITDILEAKIIHPIGIADLSKVIIPIGISNEL